MGGSIFEGMFGTTAYNFNKGDASTTFTTSGEVTVFLLRMPSWTAVDLTGWSRRSDLDGQYIDGYSTLAAYERVFPAGTHWVDTHTALYLFKDAWPANEEPDD